MIKKIVKNTLQLSNKAIVILATKGHRELKNKTFNYLSNKKLPVQYFFDEKEYEQWLRINYLTTEECLKLKEESKEFLYKPKISIAMPVYNVEEQWLIKAVESVRKQIYDNWELCIVDDASTNLHIKPLLEKIADTDSRIKVKFSEINQNISLTSNKAIDMASGEYVGFLDNDDELSPDCLFHIVKVLNLNQNLDFIYSDEDKITTSGQRIEPEFKPDWSPETIMSLMYTTHFSIYRRSLLKEINGFRTGYEGSQDYDLVLRAAETINSDKIYHIPKVLYHWRVISTSTASNIEAKPYAYINAKKALVDAVKRRNINAEVIDGLTINSFRVKRKILNNPKVSIIVLLKDNLNQLKESIANIEEKTKYQNYEIVIVGNISKIYFFYDFEMYFKKYTVLTFKSNNESSLYNYAASKTNSDHIVFMHSDIRIVNEDWIESLLEYSQLPDIGVVGCKILFPDNSIEHAGIIMGLGGVCGSSHKRFDSKVYGRMARIQTAINVLAVSGICLMIKRELFNKTGGFSEDLSIYSDVDFCLKVYDKKFRNLYTPFTCIYHYACNPSKDHFKNCNSNESIIMKEKWEKYIKNDPYYNPNFTRKNEIFGLNTGNV